MVYPITKRAIYLLLNPFVKKIKGIENIPKDEAFIIASNHESYIDPILMMVIMWRTANKKVHYLALAKLFRSSFRKVIWQYWLGGIPVYFDERKEFAIKEAIDKLKEGSIVGIFPEGPKKDAKLIEGKTGVIRIALAAKAPILPVGLKNTYQILPMEKWIPRKYKKLIKVNIGKPIYLDYTQIYDKKRLRNSVDKLMNEIARLRNEI